jgi:hypothetical protein
MPNIAPTKYECDHCGITQPPWATNESFNRTQYMNCPSERCPCTCHEGRLGVENRMTSGTEDRDTGELFEELKSMFGLAMTGTPSAERQAITDELRDALRSRMERQETRIRGLALRAGHAEQKVERLEQGQRFTPEEVTKLRNDFKQAEQERAEAQAALSWALDLIDKYDEFLVELGEPREHVYSDVHVAGKAKARIALTALDQEKPKPATEEP